MKRLLLISVVVIFAASACAQKGPTTLTIMTHDAFAASESVISAFEQANNVKLEFLKSGDAGAALNKAILSKDAPLADVFYGVDNTFLSLALENDLFEPYASPLLASIPDEYKLDPQNRALPVDDAPVCINYDKAYFSSHNLPVPETLEDLTKPRYNGLLVTEDPGFSSTGLSFLLATIAHFGENGYLDYWSSLAGNGLKVADGWDTAYFSYFSALSGGQGTIPMVVSYATSPVAEVVLVDPPLTDAPTASIIGPDTCFHQIEFVGILKGTKNPDLAQKFVDYMLGTKFQEDMPLQMFVYPVNENAVLPQVFVQYAQVPAQSASIDPATIAANRAKWIADWRSIVIQ